MKNRKGFGKLIQFALIGLIVLSLTFITAPAIISFYDVALDASSSSTSENSTLYENVDTGTEWNNAINDSESQNYNITDNRLVLGVET